MKTFVPNVAVVVMFSASSLSEGASTAGRGLPAMVNAAKVALLHKK